MTVQNPCIFLQGGSHPAEDVRRWIGSIYDDASGVLAGDALAVTEKSGTPDMSVDVAGGKAILAGDEQTYQGSYFVENRGTENLAIAAADGTNPRIDLVVAKVEDSEYSGATDEWSLAVVTGTPAASPVAPTEPSSCLILAEVLVAAASSDVEDADITDVRTKIGPYGYAPGVKAVRSGEFNDQPISTGTHTAVILTSASEWDTDGYHPSSGVNTELTVPAGRAGRYLCTAYAEWTGATSSVSGRRIVEFLINGTANRFGQATMNWSGGIDRHTTSAELWLDVGDVMELGVWQNQQSSLGLNIAYITMTLVSI